MNKEQCRSHAKRLLASGLTVDEVTERIHSIATTVSNQERRMARVERGKLVDEILVMLEAYQRENRWIDVNPDRRAALEGIILALRALADPESEFTAAIRALSDGRFDAKKDR